MKRRKEQGVFTGDLIEIYLQTDAYRSSWIWLTFSWIIQKGKRDNSQNDRHKRRAFFSEVYLQKRWCLSHSNEVVRSGHEDISFSTLDAQVLGGSNNIWWIEYSLIWKAKKSCLLGHRCTYSFHITNWIVWNDWIAGERATISETTEQMIREHRRLTD